MKRYLMFFFVFFFFQKIHATHNFGGEIILNQIGDKQYEAKLITYTRFVPSNPSSGVESLILCWGDGFCEPVSRDTFYELDCALKQTIYKSNHTYEEEGTYTLASSDLNRGSGILNINPPTSHNVPFHVQTKITVTNSWNRFPIFMNPPTDVGQVNTVFQHNPAVIDLDGDSLSFSLIVPMEGLDQGIWTYIFPNEILPGLNNNLTIDEERGTITWDAPQLAGYYSLAILIKEHRNGIILSETIRDFRVTIAPIGTIPNLSPVINIDVDEVTLSVGDEFNFEVICDELEGNKLWCNHLDFHIYG